MSRCNKHISKFTYFLHEKAFCTVVHHPACSGQKFVHKTISLSLLSAFDMHRRHLSLILIGGSQNLTKVTVHVSYHIP